MGANVGTNQVVQALGTGPSSSSSAMSSGAGAGALRLDSVVSGGDRREREREREREGYMKVGVGNGGGRRDGVGAGERFCISLVSSTAFLFSFLHFWLCVVFFRASVRACYMSVVGRRVSSFAITYSPSPLSSMKKGPS